MQPCSDLWVERASVGGTLRSEMTWYVVRPPEASSLGVVVPVGGLILHRDAVDPSELKAWLESLLPSAPGPDSGSSDGTVQASLGELEKRVRATEGLDHKLLTLLGGVAIRRHLPPHVLQELNRTGLADGLAVTRAALALHGASLLSRCTRELREKGFHPPTKWQGTDRALAFVRGLGLPDEMAGSPGPSLDREIEVEGPVSLPDLHDFQEKAVAKIHALLRGDGDGCPLRGLLSLPTGAGKTRTAVESIVRGFRERFVPEGSWVLWVAHTDELCEQAVQCWKQLWQARGPSERLVISRHWQGRGVTRSGAAQVVVSTIQTLHSSRMEELAWLRDPALIVVDEAHRSTAKTYTELFHHLGVTRAITSRPVLGLTATPFRGARIDVVSEETRALAARYSNHRLDEGLFGEEQPYEALRRMGVLSDVRMEVLEGSHFELTSEEVAQMAPSPGTAVEPPPWLPASAEGRLGGLVERNDTLLRRIRALDPEWPVIVFATSLPQAEILAAILTRDGIPSATISGSTDRGARRQMVKDFRVGRIRILTNYNVLSEGFDVPSVRVVIVARPVFSPVRYQQIVGRGLRGTRNGGKEECLIINVADNIVNFGRQLAFRDFEHLWMPRGRTSS